MTVTAVESAADMRTAVMNEITDADLFIGSAAVADYRPDSVATQKIKKTEQTMQISLVKNPDILYDVSHLPQRPFTVGFAAESEKVIEHARGKLDRKKLDLIVANDISRSDIGFNQDANEVVLITQTSEHPLPKASKQALADQIIAFVCTQMAESA